MAKVGRGPKSPWPYLTVTLEGLPPRPLVLVIVVFPIRPFGVLVILTMRGVFLRLPSELPLQ